MANTAKEAAAARAAVGARVRAARLARGMKAVDLARDIGIKTQHSVQMQRYEKGERGMSNELLAEAARALRVPFEWLAFGVPDDVVPMPTDEESRIAYRPEPPRAAPPAVRELEQRYVPDDDRLPRVWLETLRSGRLGKVTPEDERAAIAFCVSPEGGANEGGLTVDDLVAFVEAFRERRPRKPEQTEAGKKITEEARQSAAAKGIMPLVKPKRPPANG